ADPATDDLLEPDKASAADEQDLARVHLDVLLLRVLAAPLRRDVGDSAFEHLQQRLLHAFAADVAGDADIRLRLADLVDLIDVDDAPLSRLEVVIGRLE